MSPSEQVKRLIEDLDEADRTAVFECHAKLLETVRVYGAPGMMALALLGAEIAEGTTP